MNSPKPYRYNDGDRWHAALVQLGHKNMHAVVIDDAGVRVISEPLAASRHCQPLLLRGKDYPVERMVKLFRRVGKERGITKGALDILAEVA